MFSVNNIYLFHPYNIKPFNVVSLCLCCSYEAHDGALGNLGYRMLGLGTRDIVIFMDQRYFLCFNGKGSHYIDQNVSYLASSW